MGSFDRNLTLERARELLHDIISYVEISGNDATEDAVYLLKLGFTKEELKELWYGSDTIEEAVREVNNPAA